MAAATSSENVSPHRPKGRLLVTMIEPCSYLLATSWKKRFAAYWSKGLYPTSSRNGRRGRVGGETNTCDGVSSFPAVPIDGEVIVMPPPAPRPQPASPTGRTQRRHRSICHSPGRLTLDTRCHSTVGLNVEQERSWRPRAGCTAGSR